MFGIVGRKLDRLYCTSTTSPRTPGNTTPQSTCDDGIFYDKTKLTSRAAFSAAYIDSAQQPDTKNQNSIPTFTSLSGGDVTIPTLLNVLLRFSSTPKLGTFNMKNINSQPTYSLPDLPNSRLFAIMRTCIKIYSSVSREIHNFKPFLLSPILRHPHLSPTEQNVPPHHLSDHTPEKLTRIPDRISSKV